MEITYGNPHRQYLSIKKEIDTAIQDCIKRSSFIGGYWHDRFEAELGEYINQSSAVVGSGTAAQQLSLLALGIGPGDEVLVPSMTFFSTAETVSQVGATPVFVDCELEYYCMDLTDFKNKITSKTRAVMPVDLYGQHANLREIRNICDLYDLYLIQDSAQSFGSLHHGQPVGAFADLAIHSFYPAKNFDCMGDGGAVSGSEELVNRVRKLRDHGRTEKYVHTEIGWNHRLDGIQASILCAKHPYVDQWNNSRCANAEFYNNNLKHLPIKLPVVAEYNTHVYNQYVIMIENRDTVFDYLNSKGIQAGIQFPIGCHQQPAYNSSEILPNTEYVSSHCLSLPVFPLMKQEELDYVVSCLTEYFDS